ncbi:MAG: glycosyltransferase family 2 protein [Campylobacterales bacterium]
MRSISVVILTKNSECYLSACLDALREFDEVIILDNGSTDATLSIASSYPNTTIHRHDFIGFGPMKNLGASLAKHDWILSIDSDEVMTDELLSSISSLTLDPRCVYGFSRLNHYAGKPIKCCGWYPDVILRLYHRAMTSYGDKLVHESLNLQGVEVKILKGNLRHYSFDNVEGLLTKLQHYSTLYAQEHAGRKKITPTMAVIKTIFSFFRNYILQRGCLYGWQGLLISVSNACGVFYKYMKLYEENLRRGM